jgi:hypothetical protein
MEKKLPKKRVSKKVKAARVRELTADEATRVKGGKACATGTHYPDVRL